jgi:hypothetical protein
MAEPARLSPLHTHKNNIILLCHAAKQTENNNYINWEC